MMKAFKLTLIALLAVCFAYPANGGVIKPERKHGVIKQLGMKRTKMKKESVVPPETFATFVLKRQIQEKLAKEERKKTAQEEQATQETPAQTAQQAVAQTAQQQQAFSEANCAETCRLLKDDELYEAEAALQQIRDTYDPAASFEKYPWLMYEHSETCPYHQKQPIPGTEGAQQTQTPTTK